MESERQDYWGRHRRVRLTRRTLLAGMSASLSAAFLAACGGSSSNNNSSAPTAAAKPVGAATTAGTAAPAGTARPISAATAGVIKRPDGITADENATWDAIDQAYTAAQKAGEKNVLFYEGPAAAQVVQKNFGPRFPGITMDFKDGTSNPSGFILQEMQAGQKTADVLGGSIQYFAGLAQANQIDPAIDWKGAGIDPERVSPINTVVTADLVLGPVFIYNTQTYKPTDIPTTLDGWFVPKFKGKMAATSVKYFSGMGWYGISQGQDAAIALAKRFVDEGYLTLSDNAYTLLLSGEKPVVPFDATWQQVVFQRQSAPTALKVYNPGLGVTRWQAGVIKGTKSPNLSKMLVLWLSTAEGVKGYFDVNAWDWIGRKGSYIKDQLAKDNVNVNDLPKEDAQTWQNRTAIAAKARQAVLGQ